jgi:hypothetical protein
MNEIVKYVSLLLENHAKFRVDNEIIDSPRALIDVLKSVVKEYSWSFSADGETLEDGTFFHFVFLDDDSLVGRATIGPFDANFEFDLYGNLLSIGNLYPNPYNFPAILIHHPKKMRIIRSKMKEKLNKIFKEFEEAMQEALGEAQAEFIGHRWFADAQSLVLIKAIEPGDVAKIGHVPDYEQILSLPWINNGKKVEVVDGVEFSSH